jgi:Rha family phage regulatory protein
MNELVEIKDGKVFAASIAIAKAYNKRHVEVMRDIQNLGCSKKFKKKNFIVSNYRDIRNKKRRMYILSEAGQAFLYMSYNCETSDIFKESYIESSDKTEALLYKIQKDYSNLIEEMQKVFDADLLNLVANNIKENKKSYIYILQDKTNNCFKIGRTTKIDERIKIIQAGYPNKLYLLYVFEGGSSIESHLHRKYSNKRLNGEWFNLSKNDINEIKNTYERC